MPKASSQSPRPEHHDYDPDSVASQRTQTAKEIADLQERILRLAHNRERLPQPLFWSLFNSRINEIKKQKELSRLLDEVLG